MKLAILLVVLVGCEQTHRVSIQLGPTPDTLSQGFLCRESPGGPFMVTDALSADRTKYEISVLIDLVELPGFPGCRGEELVAACNNGPCTIARTPTRFCASITFDADLVPDNSEAVVGLINEALAEAGPVTRDAPDGTVVIRAIATAQTCSEFEANPIVDQLVGCAHSCPVQLDAVDGPIALSLDTLDDNCRGIVEACARFPDFD